MDQWWLGDPVSLAGQDADARWRHFDPPPSLAARLGFKAAGFDQIARATAVFLGYGARFQIYELQLMWAGLVGAIEHSLDSAFPDGVRHRVDRATMLIPDDFVFVAADLFGIGHRFVPKGVQYRHIPAQIRREVGDILTPRITRLPPRRQAQVRVGKISSARPPLASNSN
jgi:hypothetical protein